MSNEAVIAAQVELARLNGAFDAKSAELEKLPDVPPDPKRDKLPATVGFVSRLVLSVADNSIEVDNILMARIALLEAKLAEIEDRGLRFRGAYQRALTYRTGDVVVFKGAPWAALEATIETPGTGRAWQMIMRPGGSDDR